MTPRPTCPRRRTTPASRRPEGIVSSILVSLIAGWILILAITFVIPTNYDSLHRDAVQEFAPVLIWIDAIGRHGGRTSCSSSPSWPRPTAAWPR